MIAYIHGQLVEKTPTRIIVEASGVGYELIIPLSTYERLPHTGGDVKILTHHAVREDDEVLYGFSTEQEKVLFLKLLLVSGVGPRIALAILSGASIGELSLAIASGDAKRLSSIKGVGKKTAEKICVELKDKIDLLEAQSLAGGAGKADDAKLSFVRDAVAALRALGFADEVASKMVADVVAKHPEIDDVERLIKASLGGNK